MDRRLLGAHPRRRASVASPLPRRFRRLVRPTVEPLERRPGGEHFRRARGCQSPASEVPCAAVPAFDLIRVRFGDLINVNLHEDSAQRSPLFGIDPPIGHRQVE